MDTQADGRNRNDNIWTHKQTVETGNDKWTHADSRNGNDKWTHKLTVEKGNDNIWTHKLTVETGNDNIWTHKQTVETEMTTYGHTSRR